MPRINAKNYCYFVQSIESKFYNANNDDIIRQLVDSTYKIGMPIITEATWIKDYLSDHYNINAYLVKNGIRKDVYTSDGSVIESRLGNGKLRILVEGPLGVDFKNTKKALEIARKSNADEVWLMTSTPLKRHKLADRVFSQVPIFRTPEIYRSCDIVLKLSYVEGMFGPPLEMFHCGGTAIVYDVTGHDEYMVHKYNSYVVHRDNESKVIDYINYLKKHYSVLHDLQRNASITASNWHDWDKAASDFECSLVDIANRGTIVKNELQQTCSFFFKWYVIAENYRLKYVNRGSVNKIKQTFKLLKIKFTG
jgi:glycosyltransferase involved in cell wall biosynthesis